MIQAGGEARDSGSLVGRVDPQFPPEHHATVEVVGLITRRSRVRIPPPLLRRARECGPFWLKGPVRRERRRTGVLEPSWLYKPSRRGCLRPSTRAIPPLTRRRN